MPEILEKINTEKLSRKEKASGYSANNTVRLVKGGAEYFALLEKLINEATRSIHLQTYIFEGDHTSKAIIRALLGAARRNVKISVLLDGYASQAFPLWAISLFHQANIEFQWFYPLFRGRKFYFGRRLHHKIFVADGTKALVGGLNISDRYNDMLEQKAWLDWAVYAEGEVAASVLKVCNARSRMHSDTTTVRVAGTFEGGCKVRVRVNDWVNRKMQIWNSYMEMLRTARSHVIIMSPYFIPGKTLRDKLCKAARRGVNVSVILGNKSDVKLARFAEKYLYPYLLRNKVRIFEYQPRILHGKIATCDGHWTTVGSYNMNNLSAFASVELNLDVENNAFAEEAEAGLRHIMDHESTEITLSDYQKSAGLLDRFLYRSAYDIIRILYMLVTLRVRQRD